jgi:hypothetical protein
MASALRVLPVPTQYYVSVTVSNEDVSTFDLSTTGVWVASPYIPSHTDVSGRVLFKDLGKTIFYNPATGNPPVDLRKVAVVSTNGLEVDKIRYIPLGTRLKGTLAQQRAQYNSCWVALIASSVAERQFGLRS